ncbi:ferredoxin [Bacillus sp. FJAT-44742]|uniref:ferredoxin n=1 Tax=Bacillus sp. FJAT-44742 TaxID=2014005 RepID=UPI000C2313D0|nr:ferredoxin [Bacillus sp. FJAT-44742]
MNKKVEVEVDSSKCVGTMMCMYEAKGVFALSGGKAKVKRQEAGSMESKMEAAENCPVSAIKIIDKDTREQIFPT